MAAVENRLQEGKLRNRKASQQTIGGVLVKEDEAWMLHQSITEHPSKSKCLIIGNKNYHN